MIIIGAITDRLSGFRPHGHIIFSINLFFGITFCVLLAPFHVAQSSDADELVAIIQSARSIRGSTELSELASVMKPGEWAELADSRPPRLMLVLTGHRENGKEAWYHIAGWTDDGHWDSKSGQYLFMGFRKHNKFIAYSDRDNAWRVVADPFGWNMSEPGTFADERKTLFGHAYGRNAVDVVHGKYYFGFAGYTYIYSLIDSKWSRVPGGASMSLEYFPGIGLVSHAVDRNKEKSGYNLDILDEISQQWAVKAVLPFSGYHALARYNFVLDEMLFIGGSKSRAVYSMNRDAQLTPHKDLPFDMTIREGKLVVDPASGRYLIFHSGELYEFDSVKNEYRKVARYKAPWGRYEMPVPASIPEYGVIMFVDKKTLLYKHAPQ